MRSRMNSFDKTNERVSRFRYGFTLVELLDDLLVRRRLTGEPSMSQDFADGRSVHGIGLEHASDQVLERVRQPICAIHVVVLPEAFLVTVLDLLE